MNARDKGDDHGDRSAVAGALDDNGDDGHTDEVNDDEADGHPA